jgi:hypothetical protein
MSSLIEQQKTYPDWFEEVSQKLDVLRQEAIKFADDGDILPDDSFFEHVKQTVRDLRHLTNFQLVTPDVWLGPDGQIGLTWTSGTRNFDLIFTPDSLIARSSVDGHQQTVEPSLIPIELKQFAA